MRIAFLLFLAAGCASGSKVVLRSNQANTEFFIDGRPVGKGKTLDVYVDAKPHEVGAKAPGYILKTDTINPPYHVGSSASFFFLIEDQERYAVGAQPTPPRSDPVPVPVRVPVPPQEEEPLPKGPARVWLFAVGISKYQIADISLEFADKDAEAIGRFFASDRGGSVPETRLTVLTNDRATRGAVLSALTRMAKRAAPNDLLVLYLAMHGLPDEGGDLYYLTHDTDPRQLVGTGLPQRDVEYALASSPAKRVVMLMDACHAGAAGLGFSGKRGIVLAETNRLLGRLAETKPGVAVLTASSATEPSNEGAQWGGGHGVFTHYLLMGMSGHADGDRDGLVSIRELYDFVYTKVSEDTGGVQHPELKGRFDNAMPLSNAK
jgi:hypothetical protein